MFKADVRPIGSNPAEVVLRRLRSLAPISEREASLVLAMGAQRQTLPAGAEIFGQGHLVGRPKVLLSGWACRCRVLPDGRRQIFTFVVPGDAVGLCSRPDPVLQTTTIALTKVITADASPLAEAAFERGAEFEGLCQAVSVAGALDEASLLDHIVRLGRQTAYERMAHLLLELRWRLSVVGLASERRFPLPLTQEVLADALGLSIVHVNRTLQQLRREGLLEMRAGAVELLKPEVLVAASDFRLPLPVSEDEAGDEDVFRASPSA
ncbi:MAG TPA: helix-turn-helix domain-containing protein [Caulobacteraceae bacterium]|nr:helix-turn-helix domain-containing protein [Caulobacteraceae bacterium]